MKIVNINDIEDLILAKHEIDLLRIEHNEISERSVLQEFINTYASPQYIYLINEKQLSFNFINVWDHYYLFISEDTKENEFIINKIKHLKYDMNNLTKLTNSDLLNMVDTNNIIIYKNHYYN